MNEFSALREKAGLSIPAAAALTGHSERTVFRWENGDVKPKRPVLELLRAQLPLHVPDKAPNFEFIDLFAGIGGLRRGFEAVGGSCTFTSEWNDYSRRTYRANFPDDDHEIAGDIRGIAASDIPAHDLLLAGFPCQPFSLAGVSKKNALGREHGFRCEAQGTLFFDIARIIEHHRPRAFVLENVKNLVSHDKGQTFRVIHEALTKELGYEIHTRVVEGFDRSPPSCARRNIDRRSSPNAPRARSPTSTRRTRRR